MEKTVIDTIKEALEIFDAMEMTRDKCVLNMTYDAALAVVKEIEALSSRNDKLLLSVKRLEKQLEQVTKERDAAVEDLEYAGSRDGEFCSICKYGETGECVKRKFEHVDCREWRGVEEVQYVNNDLISRSALLEAISEVFFKSDPTGEEQLGILKCSHITREFPAVDAEPVRHGSWYHGECSVCKIQEGPDTCFHEWVGGKTTGMDGKRRRMKMRLKCHKCHKCVLKEEPNVRKEN